ncbi:MAG: SUMF1/EgtB/PvdO family nonheme iron enzyme, partial [Planctomycetia bacterium]|nr:SUMF1/EgtB/PvdO family nonheme iron enzyme [Planctomycetia bacterium]
VAQISRSGTAGTYTYAVMNSTGNRPITYVNWFDCARFSNWMSNGQPSGAQTSTTTEDGAYNVNGVTSGNAVAANATNPNTLLAPTYRIPLENEWYKAAYYSPEANYNNAIGHSTDVGSFSGSGSFYGTFDQTGNVWQWNDLDGTAGSSRGRRGGGWNNPSSYVSSSSLYGRYDFDPSLETSYIGFRLASPPTPTLTPAFGATTATLDGFIFQITNYDSNYTWAGTATASGSVVVSGTGLVTVTGVAAGTSAIATITTTKTGHVGGSADVTATSLVAMSMMTVGNAGNATDANTGSVYGAVSYSYQIGAYDVTGLQYTAFLNAVGSTDTYALYDAYMATDTNVAQISQSGSSGSYTYAVLNSTGSRPISYVSGLDCARFANWMSNGQPSGAQSSTTTENGAYNVNGANSYPANAVVANATNPNTGLAPTFRIPLENEWYKAAYYSPNYGGTGVGGYYTYATQSSVAPGTTIGSSTNQANYDQPLGTATDVGSFSGSGSFYGTFDQSGNVFQWNDLDGTAGSERGWRGGAWSYDSNGVSSSFSFSFVPSFEFDNIGFRLASPVTGVGDPAP